MTNYGGGNTSSKIVQTDPLTGKEVEVLWVKGSGGDLGTIKADGFSTLYMDKLTALQGLYRGLSYEDEMVGYLQHCTFNLNPRAASIDTPLHAYVPRPFVDHMHPDADYCNCRLERQPSTDCRDIWGHDWLAAMEAPGL